MTPLFRSFSMADSRGSVLLEVLVALVLLAVLTISLAEGADSAMERAHRLHYRAAGADETEYDPSLSGAWNWGPRVTAAAWRPGPVLDVEVEGGEDTGVVVGLWVDGWFLGERPVEAGSRLSVGTFEWEEVAGAALIVRVREPESPWGEPWRSLVADSAGGLVFLPEALGGSVPEPGPELPLVSVAHSARLANPSLEISWGSQPLQADMADLVFELPACSAGRCEATSGSRTQSWWMEGSRAIDLYF